MSARGNVGRRFAGVSLGVVLALLLLAPAGAAGKGHVRARRGTLRIVVAGLQHAERARLTITGPAGFHRTLTRSATLRLRPGAYRVTAQPIAIPARSGIPSGSKNYASPSAFRLLIRSGARTVVRVRYGNVISSATRLRTPTPSKILGSATDPSAITLPASGHVSVGQIIYYPPSATFPVGLFSKVISITPQGRDVLVGLRAASLSEAFPEINVSEVLPIGKPPAGAAADRVFGGPIASIADVNVSLSNGPFECGTSASSPPTLDYPLSLSPSLDAEIHKPLFGPLSARFVIGLSGSAGLRLTVPEGTGCSADLAKLGPYPIGVIPVGPIEIPVTAEIKASASLELSGPLTIDAGVSLQTHVGFNYANGNFSPVFDATPSGHATATYQGGKFKIGPELEIAAGLAHALDANVTAGLFDVLQGSSPSAWQLGAEFDIGAGLEAAGIGKLKIPVFEKFFPLAEYPIPHP